MPYQYQLKSLEVSDSECFALQ